MLFRPGEIVHHRFRIEKVLQDRYPLALYFAADLQVKQMCLLKQTRDLSRGSAPDYARELSELQQVDLSCVPGFIDGFQDSQHGTMIAWSLVKGDILTKLATNLSPLMTITESVKWIIRMGRCLSELHHCSYPIYHLEICPDNILVTSTSQPYFIHLGFAHIPSKEQRSKDLMKRINPGYSAPECYTSKPAIPHSDIYSLAAVLYFLVTGKEPVPADRRYKGERLNHPDELNPDLPMRLGNTIMQAMSIDPSKRYQNMAEFIGHLEEVIKPGFHYDGSQETPVETKEETEKKEKSKPGAFAWIFGLLAVIIVVGGLTAGILMLGNPVDILDGIIGQAATATISPTPGPSETRAPTRTLAPTYTPVTPSPTAVPPTRTATATATHTPTAFRTNTPTITIYPVGPHRNHLAPDFTLYTMTGEQVKLSDYLGSPVVVNFWATWCPPCRDEFPGFINVYEEFKDQGLVILAVNTTNTDTRADVHDFVDQNRVPFIVLLDTTNKTSLDYQISGLPTSFFINTEGLIEHVELGSMTESAFRNQVQQIIP